VTISDIAERAGVSIGAVSFALNGRKGVSESTRARVLAVADELGWAPASAARSLAEARTETIGLVLARDPRNLGVESFYMRFFAGVELVLGERGYGLLLQIVPGVDEELATIRKWRNARRIDGLLLVDLRVGDPRVDLALESPSLPTVVVGHASVARGLMSVGTDDDLAARTAVRHLVALGHRRIARVSGPEAQAHTVIRDAALRDELDRVGGEATVLRTDFTPEAGAAATRRALAAAERPTAIVYDNDVMAVAGLAAIVELDLEVPGDVSIVAWDDSVLCEHTLPRLTALRHDVVEYGAHAARRLFELIDGGEPGAHLEPPLELVVRGSTAAPRA